MHFTRIWLNYQFLGNIEVMPEIIVFVVSLAAVIFGADWVGNASVHLSQRLYLPRVLIGATFVSVATTLPEIIIGGFSAIEDQPALGIGTVFGSPITNIGLVLGIILLFSKVKLQDAHYIRTIQLFLAILVVVFLISATGFVTPLLGLVLILFGAAYLVIEFAVSKHEETFLEKIETRFERLKDYFTNGTNYHQIFYLVGGGILLFIGAHFLINSAAAIAGTFGIPQIVIGISIIAFGTSLPEIVTAINSIIKKRVGLSVGNLFGASILDYTFALGLIGLFGKAEIDQTTLYFGIGTASVLAVFSLIPVFGKISPKILGVLSICIYAVFLLWFTSSQL